MNSNTKRIINALFITGAVIVGCFSLTAYVSGNGKQKVIADSTKINLHDKTPPKLTIEDLYSALRTTDSLMAKSDSIIYKQDKVKALIMIGSQYMDINLDSALKYFHQGLPLAIQINDDQSHARILSNIGISYNNQGKLDEAKSYHSTCLTLSKKIGDQKMVARTLANLGLLERRLSRYHEALKYFKESTRIANETNLQSIVGYNLNQQGIIYVLWGNHRVALNYYEEALKLFIAIGDKTQQSRSLSNIGRSYAELGEYQKALDYFHEAHRMNEELGIINTFETVHSISNTYMILGEMGKAREYAEKSMKICQDNDNQSGIAYTWDLLGEIENSNGHYSEALDYYFKAIKIHESMENQYGLAGTQKRIGDVYSALDEDSVANAYFHQSLAIGEKITNPDIQATAILAIGDLYRKQGKLKDAIANYNRALTIQEGIGNQGQISQILTHLGSAFLILEDYPKATEYLERSYALHEQCGHQISLPETLTLLAKIYYKNRSIEKAISLNDKAFSVASKLSNIEDIKNASELMSEIYFNTGDFEKAFRYQSHFMKMKDSLYNSETAKAIGRLETAHELDQKKKENELLKKDKLIYQKDLKRERIISISIGIGFTFSLIIIFQLYRSNQIKKMIITQRSEIMQINGELKEKNRELDDLNQEKNNFMSILAHDLRSPLNHVKGLIALLQMTAEAKNSEQEKYFQLIHESIGRQQDMIARILDGAAIDSRNFNVNIESVNAAKVLSSSVNTLKEAADKKQLKLKLGINCMDCFIEADPGYLAQVFENLISNAIKFSPAGKNIAVSLYEKDGNIITEVADEGPGISSEDMKKLFKRFSRLSAKPTAGEKSTGLGLSIVKTFVNAMNGNVWCESELNKGTSFLVAFKKMEEKSFQKVSMA